MCTLTNVQLSFDNTPVEQMFKQIYVLVVYSKESVEAEASNNNIIMLLAYKNIGKQIVVRLMTMCLYVE